jgi:putative phosphoesterase
MREADLILHAGDFVEAHVVHELERLGPPLAGIHGNVDSAEVRGLLPAVRTVKAGAARIGMVHNGGPAHGRLARLRTRFPGADAVVFGHSHIPLHERDGELRIFNPGSPTDRRRQPHGTIGVLRIEDGRVLSAGIVPVT